ncbi:hypothetical protein M9H77_07516 [Catharanthus roseus]|uniref:Uncharacterized protein n=1 Tax=Catharanthus roseus TaxID=4058 RepID=A0ACC0BV94_CATRO|nr:hypothetical protein M9H77_07516 [Catharanthus roseus]
MVKTKNGNIGRGENVEEGGSSRGRGKGKRMPSRVKALDRFIYVKEATNFEEWTKKRRKIAPGHRVDLNDMEVGDHIGPRKIYNQHTFKRMGFAKNEEGLFVRGGQNKSDEDDDDDDNEEQEEMTQCRRIITMQSQLNSRLDNIDGKLHNRLDNIDEKINKRSIFEVSRLHYIETKDLCDQGIMKKKRSSNSKINSLDEISFTNYT